MPKCLVQKVSQLTDSQHCDYIDYVINCNQWWDHGYIKLVIDNGLEKENDSDDYEIGRLVLNTHLNPDEQFSFYIHTELFWRGSLLDEDTSSGFCSTKPFVEKLSASGNLQMKYQQPGSTVECEIIIKNKGMPHTELDWEIVEWPEWGTWDFEPPSGNNLMPKDGKVKIDVTIKLPNERKKFTGTVLVVNRNNHDDKVEIPVVISASRNRATNNPLYNLLAQQHPVLLQLFQRFLNL